MIQSNFHYIGTSLSADTKKGPFQDYVDKINNYYKTSPYVHTSM